MMKKKRKARSALNFKKPSQGTKEIGDRRQKVSKKKARMEHGKPYHFYPGNPLIL
jgi:hypothetical protein